MDKKQDKTEKKPKKEIIKVEEKGKKQIQKSDLEGSLEKQEFTIDESRFLQFIRSSGDTSPTLNQVSSAPEIITLERQVRDSPTPASDKKEEESFKYMASSDSDQEKKYISSSSHISANPSRVDFSQIGRSSSQSFSQDVHRPQWSEASSIQSELHKYETTRDADSLDISQAGRQDPFKTEEKKYTPKLPY